MINVKPLATQDNILLSSQEAILKLREIGQLRRAKMHTSCIIKNIDDKSTSTPTLCKLLETSLIFETKSTKILAGHLFHSSGNIFDEYQRLLMILDCYSRRSALHATTEDSLYSREDSHQ